MGFTLCSPRVQGQAEGDGCGQLEVQGGNLGWAGLHKVWLSCCSAPAPQLEARGSSGEQHWCFGVVLCSAASARLCHGPAPPAPQSWRCSAAWPCWEGHLWTMHGELTFTAQGNDLKASQRAGLAEGSTRGKTMHRTHELHTNVNTEFSVSCVRET